MPAAAGVPGDTIGTHSKRLFADKVQRYNCIVLDFPFEYISFSVCPAINGFSGRRCHQDLVSLPDLPASELSVDVEKD